MNLLTGEMKQAYELGYEDARYGAPKTACPYGCAVGIFRLRTAWIAGWRQFQDEQEQRHEAA